MLSRLILTTLPALAALCGSTVAAPATNGDGDQIPLFTVAHDGDIDLSKYTIAQILNYSLHHPPHHDRGAWPGHRDDRHHPSLHKLAYLVNRSEPVKSYLSKEDISVTLFAPDDEALTPPRRRRQHGLVSMAERAEGHPEDHPFYHAEKEGDSSDDDDDDEEERRRKTNMLITAILKYHVAPAKYSVEELLDKQTIPTILQQTKDREEPFRIRGGSKFELLPPPPRYELVLNFYAKKRAGPSILAKNGVIHLLSAPLFPPLTPFDLLLQFPLTFSTLTSAIQQTEVDALLAPWYHHHKDRKDDLLDLAFSHPDEPSTLAMAVLEEMVEEAKAAFGGLPRSDEYAAFPFTIFAPTNLAVAKIPFKIRLFLFSPFGRNILKKVLAYHVLPQFIFHTDHIVNATRKTSYEGGATGSFGPQSITLPSWLLSGEEADETIFGGFPPAMSVPGLRGVGRSAECEVEKYVLPTLLGKEKNETLAVNVYTYREGLGGKGPLKKRVTVGNLEQEEKEYVSVAITDGVAWGGAIHVINSFIMPPFAHHHRDHDHDHDHEGDGEDDGHKATAAKYGGRKHGGLRHAYTREHQIDYFDRLWA